MNAENWNTGNKKEADSEDKIKETPSEKSTAGHTRADADVSQGHTTDSHIRKAQSRVTAEFKPKTKFLATPASMKPRRTKKGKTRLYISAAALIIIISAVVTFMVMNRSEEQEFREAMDRIDAALPGEAEQADTADGREAIQVPGPVSDLAIAEPDRTNPEEQVQESETLPITEESPAESEQRPAAVDMQALPPVIEKRPLFVKVHDKEETKPENIEQPVIAANETVSRNITEPETEIQKPETRGAAIQEAAVQDNAVREIVNSDVKVQKTEAVAVNPETALVVASAENAVQKVDMPPVSELGIVTALYEEKFDGNVNNWDVFDSAEASAKIIGGAYFLEHKRQAGSRIILHNGELPHDRDFMIEVSMEHIMSSGPFSYGFVFGAKDVLNNYSFQIVGNGMYSVRKDTDGVSRELAGGNIPGVEIRTDAPNIIKVLRQGSEVYFFVNDHFIHGVSNMTFFGDRTGFILSGKLKAAVDWTRTEIGK